MKRNDYAHIEDTIAQQSVTMLLDGLDSKVGIAKSNSSESDRFAAVEKHLASILNTSNGLGILQKHILSDEFKGMANQHKNPFANITNKMFPAGLVKPTPTATYKAVLEGVKDNMEHTSYDDMSDDSKKAIDKFKVECDQYNIQFPSQEGYEKECKKSQADQQSTAPTPKR